MIAKRRKATGISLLIFDKDVHSPDMIRDRIEDAGRTIVMLPGSVRPKGYGSSMPEHIREYIDTLDYSEEGLKVIEAPASTPFPKPTSRDITELDEVLDWILMLSRYCENNRIPWVYGAVRVAMLHHPITGRRFFSWRKLGRHFGCNHQTIRNWYDDGIDIIARELRKGTNSRFREKVPVLIK